MMSLCSVAPLRRHMNDDMMPITFAAPEILVLFSLNSAKTIRIDSWHKEQVSTK